jgi:protein-S-isoprenylcysteine O-methyltransferase Ste14
MDTQLAAVLASAGYALFLLLAFGLRSLAHWLRTGSTGFVGLTGSRGSAERWGGLLFAAAVVLGGAAPVLQVLGVVQPLAGLSLPLVQAAGALCFVAGITATLWAQFAMGDSWRIGVDASERTALVSRGPFRLVRNPIFTAMFAATIGLALLVPNVVAFLTVAAMVLALEIQVRLVEEPYLAVVHGDAYRRYAASAGRFLPGIGKLHVQETS